MKKAAKKNRFNKVQLGRLFGPAFVAAVAYVDPGNVAANLSAGAEYRYLLVWVLVLANLMAVLIQYLSAKLGIATGQSLPELIGQSLPRWGRLAFLAQAEIAAIATDMAEVIGGAIAIYLLFGIPLVWSGLITGAISLLLLYVQSHSRNGKRRFELIITALLLVITIGFVAGLFISGFNAKDAIEGLIPHFKDSGSALLAVSMIGATVMPHAIYLHSAMTKTEHVKMDDPASARKVMRSTRWDVWCALLIAGSVNIAMLLLAASSLGGQSGTDTIIGAHAAIVLALGGGIGLIFTIGLLASGLASTSVGAYAGVEIMSGLTHRRIPLLVQRLITLVPAIVVLAVFQNPTSTLVVSQVILSFCIPFAVVPLVVYTSRKELMGKYANNLAIKILAWAAAAIIIVFNVILLVMTL